MLAELTAVSPTDWLAWASAGFAGVVCCYLLVWYIPAIHTAHREERANWHKQMVDLSNRITTAFIETVHELRANHDNENSSH